MNRNNFFIIALVFSLNIAIQSAIQLTRVSFIVPGETMAYNFGHITGLIVRVLGGIVIAAYFMRRFYESRRSGS